MRRAFFFCAVLWFAGVSGGCSTEPSFKEQLQADYGVAPSRDEVRAGIDDWTQGSLKDPSSAQIDSTFVPEKGWYRENGVLGPNHFGWIVRARINAKNAFGAYVGFRQYTFFFENGRLMYTRDTTPVN